MLCSALTTAVGLARVESRPAACLFSHATQGARYVNTDSNTD